MFLSEMTQGLEDMVLNDRCLGIGIIGIVGDDRGSEIGVIHRVVDGYADLKLGISVDHHACNSSPHGLYEK